MTDRGDYMIIVSLLIINILILISVWKIIEEGDIAYIFSGVIIGIGAVIATVIGMIRINKY